MRKIVVVIVLVLVLGSIYTEGNAGEEYRDVSYVYEFILENPERGDELFQQIRGKDDGIYYNCLNEKIAEFGIYAQDHYTYCYERYGQPARQAQCFQESEPAKTRQVLIAMRAASRGEQTWSSSVMARAAILGKQLLGSMYVQARRGAMLVEGPLLLCD